MVRAVGPWLAKALTHQFCNNSDILQYYFSSICFYCSPIIPFKYMCSLFPSKLKTVKVIKRLTSQSPGLSRPYGLYLYSHIYSSSFNCSTWASITKINFRSPDFIYEWEIKYSCVYCYPPLVVSLCRKSTIKSAAYDMSLYHLAVYTYVRRNWWHYVGMTTI